MISLFDLKPSNFISKNSNYLADIERLIQMKILGKNTTNSASLQSTSANININEATRMNTINAAINANTPPVASSPSNSYASQFDLSTTTLSLSKSLKSLDMPTSKFFNSSHKTNVD